MIGDRLGAEHVERGAGDLARIERGLQVLVDDERPAGHVQHADAVLALCERLGVEPPLGFGRLRQVQRQEVGDRVDGVRGLRLLDPELAVALGADIWIEGDDPHSEAAGPLGHELPNPAEPQDAEGLLEQLHPRELRAFPLAAGQ